MEADRVREQLQALGWEVKPGTMYGGLFLIAPKGSPDGHVHSRYIVQLASALTYQRLLGLLRIAQVVRKQVLLASLNSTGDILFHSVKDS